MTSPERDPDGGSNLDGFAGSAGPTSPAWRAAGVDRFVHEPVRLSILTFLNFSGPSNVAEISYGTGLTRANVLSHLRNAR